MANAHELDGRPVSEVLRELLGRSLQPAASFGCESISLPDTVVAIAGVDKGYRSFVLHGPPDKLGARFALALPEGGALIALVGTPASRGLRRLLSRRPSAPPDITDWCDTMLSSGLREIHATRCAGFTAVHGTR